MPALLLSVLLLATAAPRLEAQLLDGQWFKMTVSFDGSGVNPETSEAEAGKIKKVVNYVQFNLAPLDGSAPTYDVVVESLTTDDTWVDSGFVGSVQMLDTQETYVQTAQIGMPTKPLVLADGADLPFVLVLDATKPAPESKAPAVEATPAAPCTDGGAATEPSAG